LPSFFVSLKILLTFLLAIQSYTVVHIFIFIGKTNLSGFCIVAFCQEMPAKCLQEAANKKLRRVFYTFFVKTAGDSRFIPKTESAVAAMCDAVRPASASCSACIKK
jgi:hypothetical protein